MATINALYGIIALIFIVLKIIEIKINGGVDRLVAYEILRGIIVIIGLTVGYGLMYLVSYR